MATAMGAQKPDVVIVGGGVMGLTSAYYLARQGAAVTVLEKGQLPAGSSYGNAGLVVPSHLQPLCSPANVREGLRHLANPTGSFSIDLSADPWRMAWLARFVRHSRTDHVRYAVGIYRVLADRSLVLHDDLVRQGGQAYEYSRNGLLCIHETPQSLEAAAREAEELARSGRPARVLDADQVRDLVPAAGSCIAGGVFQEPDGRLHPAAFISWLADEVRRAGGRILEGTEVFGASLAGTGVRRLQTTKGPMEADQFVLAAGAWTGRLGAMLGRRLPVEAAKGYSITYEKPAKTVSLPLLLEEARVAVTPFADSLRLAGVLELSGLDDRLSARRIAAMEHDLRRILPGLGPLKVREIWRGFRPCTPDGLPIIGRLRRPHNVVVATGHATKGIFLGPVTGEMVSQLLSGSRLDPSLHKALDPNR
ncbi:D-amino-acid dehydrogenase [Desulfacinum hydrothermale DSM 13146]|uniref:D-amino-acid dehydrogenase n=1 Tax=Desulfacinum hydrothermale DSM 13146 TaxID=1121390 RepID=A0A1W1XNA4_9BACT|nr:FAD-dependent oxidoreductase [Desulfacinum hydrothermale]SMC24988.1 D-amino-acid dehydrogenase [Desulfacinum hydrothermale DSM 13146]